MATSEQLFRYTDSGVVTTSCCIVLFAGLLAFFLELSEFAVVIHTSSLALSIAGVVKVGELQVVWCDCSVSVSMCGETVRLVCDRCCVLVVLPCP